MSVEDNIERKNRITSFLSLEHGGQEMGDKILSLAENLDQTSAQAVFTKYVELVNLAEKEASQLTTEMEGDLDEQVIIEGLLVRAKDVLANAAERINTSDDKAREVEKLLLDLSKESRQEMVVSGLFRKTLELIKNRPDDSVDVRQLISEQDKILEQLHQEGGKGLLLRALQSKGELKPIPEIFWKVDRNLEEYEERFGFNVANFFQKIRPEENGKKVLIEFGPGSGMSKSDRDKFGLTKNYVDMAITDQVYFSVKGWVKNLLDWENIQNEVGVSLKEKDKDLLSDLIYKTIIIADDQVNLSDFEYAKERIERITNDPEQIKKVLQEVAPQLGSIKEIITDYSERDEEAKMIYPRRCSVVEKVSEEFLETKKWMTKNMDKAVLSGDVYETIPVFPSGVMVGDFLQVKSLKDNSVDSALGVRSTVYKEKIEYDEFMLATFAKLKDGGVYIDDNVRENFGRGNRIEQLKHIKKIWDKEKEDEVNIKVIFGPGIPGEDFTNDEKGVPMGLIISKNSDYSSSVKELMRPGYYLVDIEEVA